MPANPSPKRATNLSIRADLLAEAKALNINLSQAFESHLAELVRTRRRERWLAENRAAIEAYNQRVEREGVFSDDWRTF
jgi:antitoxin CcdA